ncbi:hypothetical protein ABXT72_07250 [Candidatus Pelagibacter sp. Uisw_094]|uniref:hypothetical protein n=1 Tax=Candidatus Pelagibacter sp. Uisw_094 TaxID=3230980 RepID=UPI0039E8ADA6|tara:strand:+ start:614 stop:1078 length:465 start_codon:yes stop_codon:yes gene_type:complete
MQKKVLTFIILLFLSSCGYDPIHSKKNSENYNFSISKLDFTGERDINLKIKEKLNNFTLVEKNKDFTLTIASISKKKILAKDTAGNTTNFQNIVIVKVEIFTKGKFKNNLIVEEKFNYKNEPNKFDLQKYEKEIKNNLAQIAAEKLIFRLSNIK